MNEKNKNSIVSIVILSTFFGLVAGVVGSMVVKSYFGTNSSFWGEYNFVNGNLDRPNVIISGAKKVVVDQDERIGETINLVSDSLVGIYNKKATSTKKTGIDLESFYVLGEEFGTGLVISSDGWIVTDSFGDDIFVKNPPVAMDKFVIINNKGDIFMIDKVAVDAATGFVFLHVNVKDLPVLKIAIQNNLVPGETIFSTDLSGNNYISTISSVKDNKEYLSMSSDFYYDKVRLVDELGENFNSSFIFNVSGEVVLFVDREGDLIPSRVFNSAIKSLFQNDSVIRPSLGVEYVDLAYLISSTKNDINVGFGALVSPALSSISFPWVKAGIEVGDIIKYINGTKLDIDNNLTKILMDYSPGDEVTLGILRGTEEMEIKVKLEEL